jgi:hypothetical protein
MTCPEFWASRPQILLEGWREFFPFMEVDRRCTASALNSLTRFGIYLGLLLALVKLNPAWLLVGAGFAVFAFAMWKLMESNDTIRENFLSMESPIVDPETVKNNYVPDVIGSTKRTAPTEANPFMNVLMTEYTDNPLRYAASSPTDTTDSAYLDTYFDTMFNSNPGDVFQKTQGQREFITMPSTTIPNDQESYMNWLYRTPGQTCKEGNTEACVFDTGPGQFPWREVKV